MWQAGVTPAAGPELATHERLELRWQWTKDKGWWQAAAISGGFTDIVLTMRRQLDKIRQLEDKVKQVERDAKAKELEAQKEAEATVKELLEADHFRIVAGARV